METLIFEKNIWEEFVSLYFEISGPAIDMSLLSDGEAGAKYTSEEWQVNDQGGVLSSQFLQYADLYVQTSIPSIDKNRDSWNIVGFGV